MAYHKCASIYGTNNSAASVQTASGAIANFNTKLAMPLKSLEIDVNATQDLHGQSGPYPAGGSAQIWDEETELGRFDTTTGASIDIDNQLRTKNYIPVTAGVQYYMKGTSVSSAWTIFFDNDYNVVANPDVTRVGSSISGNSILLLPNNIFTINTTSIKYMKFYLQTTYGTTYNHDISINYPSSDTAYHPYSNICPIGGWDSVKVGYVDFNQLLPTTNARGVPSYGVTYNSQTKEYTISGTQTISNVVWLDRFAIIQNHIYYALCNRSDLPSYVFSNTQTLFTSGAIFKPTNNNDIYIGLAVDTEKTYNISFKYAVIDITQAFGESIANYLWSLNDHGLSIVKQLFTKDYYPYNEGGSMVTVDSVNGEPTCQNAVINLGGTYYGGYVAQDKDGHRKLVVTKDKVVLSGSETWTYNSTGFFYTVLSLTNLTSFENVNCSNGIKGILYSNNIFRVYIADNSDYIDSSTDMRTIMTSGTEFTRTYKTPIEILLPDGTPIKTLPGVNNIYADTGDTEVSYKKLA